MIHQYQHHRLPMEGSWDFEIAEAQFNFPYREGRPEQEESLVATRMSQLNRKLPDVGSMNADINFVTLGDDELTEPEHLLLPQKKLAIISTCLPIEPLTVHELQQVFRGCYVMGVRDPLPNPQTVWEEKVRGKMRLVANAIAHLFESSMIIESPHE